jgi:hypothetical protein
MIGESKKIVRKRHSLSVDGQSESDEDDGFPIDYIKAKIEKMNENLNRLE